MGASAPTLHYAVPVSQKQEGESAIYRSPQFKEKLLETPFQGLDTIKAVYKHTFKIYAQNKCLGKIIRENKGDKVEQKIQHLTYEQTWNMSHKLGSGIISEKLQFQPDGQKLKFIGIFSKNRSQWMITDIACLLFGITTVPIYDTLGDQNISYVFNHTGLKTVFVNDIGLKALIKTHDMGSVKTIVCYDDFSQTQSQHFKEKGIILRKFQQIIEIGNKNLVNFDDQQYNVGPNDCYTFSYTSGTTGPPKGAMLSHRNFTSLFAALNVNETAKFKQSDVSLSYLPLPHVLQRAVVTCFLVYGAFTVFFSGDIAKLKEDIALVRPTIFISVPRLFVRFYDAITKKFQGVTGYAKSALDHGLKIKMKNANTNGGYTHKVYDPVFFNKTKAALGGRVRFMMTAGAPMLPDVHAFMKATMCAPLLQAYGQTQSTGGSFITHSHDPSLGHVGGPTANTEFKLVDIPEMQYTSQDKDQNGNAYPRGEIWFRGPGVFLGYYKNEQKTKEALTEDGWLRSGDVGALKPDTKGLKIIDRKKNIFKLQQGEYVASEKVENVYLKMHQISEAFLHGESTHTFAVVIVVPQQQYIEKIAKQNQIEGDYVALCKNKQIKSLLLKQMNLQAQQSGLKGFQQAKNIYIEPKTFLEKGILTNTMKIQRFQARKVYAQQIAQMYSEGMIPVEKTKKQQ